MNVKPKNNRYYVISYMNILIDLVIENETKSRSYFKKKIEMRKSCSLLRLITVIVLLISSSAAYSQSLNPNWSTDLKKSLEEFTTCTSQPSNDCNKFLNESVNTIYRINDFSSAKSGKGMTSTEIAASLKTNKHWTMIGHAYEQEILKQAQDAANGKKAVVAVYTNEAGIGHVVVITPGKLQLSGSWGLSVPNAASFFTPQPTKSFVDKSLAFAFTKLQLKDVLIYVRNY